MQDDIFDLFSTDDIFVTLSKYIDIQEDVKQYSSHYYKNIKNKIKFSDDTIIFIVCVCISIKYLIDEAVYNTLYCKLFDIELKTFNNLEIKILKKLDYNLNLNFLIESKKNKKCIIL